MGLLIFIILFSCVVAIDCPEGQYEATVIKRYNEEYYTIELFQVLLEDKLILETSFDGNYTKVLSLCMLPDKNYTASLVTRVSQGFIPWKGNVTILYKDHVLLPLCSKPEGPRAVYYDFSLPSSITPAPTLPPNNNSATNVWTVVAVVLLLGFVLWMVLSEMKKKQASDVRIKKSSVKKKNSKYERHI